jgi:signal peptidase I
MDTLTAEQQRGMDSDMENEAMPTAPEPQPAAASASSPKRGTLSWAWRLLTWLVLAAVTVIVLGLLATTVGPRVLPYQALVVRSGSMAPKIPTGSVVFYGKRAADKVKVGDIIVFNKPGDSSEKVTHRVFKITNGANGRYFTTKGDANGAPDDWQVPAVGTGWVAKFHVPQLGYVLADLQSTTARLLLLLIPALALGGITLFEIWRDRGKDDAVA